MLQFQLKWPPPPLNLLDRHAFLHVAYGLSDDGDWLFGCAVDARGQAQQAFSLRVDGAGASSLDTAVCEVYARATAFAKRADAEWRIVVARLGAPSLDEVSGTSAHAPLRSSGPGLTLVPPLFSAWERLLSGRTAGEGQALQIFVTAVVQQTQDPVLLCGITTKASSNASSPSLAAPPTTAPPSIVDATRTGSILSPRYRRPFALADSNSKPSTRPRYPAAPHPPPRKDTPPTLILPLSSFTLASSPGNPSPARGSPPSHVSSHLLLVGATPTAAAPPTADFGALGKDLADSYHALALLAHHRWLTAASDPVGRLPLHLAAVARMTKAHGMLKTLLS